MVGGKVRNPRGDRYCEDEPFVGRCTLIAVSAGHVEGDMGKAHEMEGCQPLVWSRMP